MLADLDINPEHTLESFCLRNGATLRRFKFGHRRNTGDTLSTGGVLSKGTKIGAQQFTLDEMTALVDEAHLLGLKVAVHAHGSDGIQTALQAATIGNAELFGLKDKIGSIEVGKAANIIAVTGYPLNDVKSLENVAIVMKDGNVYKNTLQK